MEAIQVKEKNNKSKVEDYVELDSFNEETSWGWAVPSSGQAGAS